MKRNKLLLALLIIAILAMTACASEPELTLGEYNGNTYSNEYFGISFDVPEEYTIATRSQLDELLGFSTEYLLEETDVSERAMKLAEEQSLYYTMVALHPMDYVDGFNPNIIMQSENLTFMGQTVVKDGEDYLEISKGHLQDTGLYTEFDDITTVELGGKEFYKMSVTADYGVPVYQDYYVTIINDQALAFIVTHFSDEGKAAMDKILDSIEFQ